MKKLLLIALALSVWVYGAYFFFAGGTEMPTQTPASPSSSTDSRDSSLQAQEVVVNYDNDGFMPKEITIKKGTKVTFTNASDMPLWVASDPHPEHTDYPEFDTPRILERLPRLGESISFTFDKPGTWEYHNHTASGDGTEVGVHPGIINVQ